HNREGGKARVEGMSRELLLEKKDGSKIWTRFALSEVIMKLTDADNAADGIFFPALEQNMMGAVLINEN
ncbi:hypothetical protein M5581_25420, partial [Escherichia coli]|nr:hypothetical protein [Escherichia coli]